MRKQETKPVKARSNGKRRLAALGGALALPAAMAAQPALAATDTPQAEAQPDGVINYSCGPAIYAPDTLTQGNVTGKVLVAPYYTYVQMRAGYSPNYLGDAYWAKVGNHFSGADLHLDWSDDADHSNWHICMVDPTSYNTWFTPAVNVVQNRWFAAFASDGAGFYGTSWIQK